MPFTLSHVAAVLPALRVDDAGVLRGRGSLVAAGLVAGSLAPDVPFFVASWWPGCHRVGMLGHQPFGMLVIDPAIAAALVAGWAAVRGPVAALLPPRVRGRAARLLGIGLPRRPHPAWFWGSAVLGAATHVAWDAFTHGGRWGARHFPVLDHRIRRVPLYHWAQYGSSAIGLAALAGWAAGTLHHAPRVAPPTVVPDLTPAARRAAALLPLAGAAAGALARHRRDRPRGISATISATSFGGGAGLAAGTAALALLLRARKRAHAGT